MAHGRIKVMIVFLLLIVSSTFPLYNIGNVEAPYVPHAPIRINNDTEFSSLALTEGWTGDGSPGNPFIIEGYDINGSGFGYCIYIGNTTDYFVVRNCYLHKASGVGVSPYFSDSGLILYNVQNATVFYNTAYSNSWQGIYLDSSSSNTIFNNTCSSNSGYGIHLWSSSGNTIKNNVAFSNSNIGIRLYSSSSNIIANNTASNNSFGIHSTFSNSNTIANNTASSNSNHGIILFTSGNNIIANNTETSNNWCGIFLKSSSSSNIIVNNTVSNNNYGIYLESSSTNTIYHNNLISNTNQAYDDSNNGNQWDNGYPSGGNYWSDYTGVDLNSTPTQDVPPPDGIGDTPYVIDSDSQDNYPLMHPAEWTPPTISGVNADPDPQNANGYVNMSANVTDNFVVSGVWAQIYYPNGTVLGNFSMLFDAITGRYYWNQTYDIIGTYSFTIWANDTANNWAFISNTFVIMDAASPMITAVTALPNPQKISNAVNISANVTDDAELYGVWVEIYDPDLNLLGNFSMVESPVKSRYYLNQTYDVIGGYSFTIWANDTTDHWSSKVGSFDIFDLPDPPGNLTAFPGDSFVNLSWDPPSDNGGSPITGYNIYRDGIFLESVGPNQLWFNDTGLTNGVTYKYNVTAVNDLGEGAQLTTSATPRTVPSAPQNLHSEAGDGFVNLTWQSPSSDGGSAIIGYKIYRSGTPEISLFGPPDKLWYYDGLVTNGVPYTYNVSAINSIGEGPKSQGASATPMTIPDAPLNLQIIPGVGYLNLTWEAPSSDGGSVITNYSIYKGISSNGETPLSDTGNVLFLNDTDVITGVKYYYKVSARNEVGEGPQSSEVNGTPLLPPNQPPLCHILRPISGEIIGGTFEISGNASDNDGIIQRVEIKIDGGNWIFATGTTSWTYDLDTAKFTNGQHAIYVRSYDGVNYSSEVTISVEVDNPKESEPEDMLWLWLLIIIIIAVSLIVALVLLKRKRPIEEEEGEDEFTEEVPPPPPKKARVSDLFEELEEGGDELDRLDLPREDDEL